jgi:hypothetical protein
VDQRDEIGRARWEIFELFASPPTYAIAGRVKSV